MRKNSIRRHFIFSEKTFHKYFTVYVLARSNTHQLNDYSYSILVKLAH